MYTFALSMPGLPKGRLYDLARRAKGTTLDSPPDHAAGQVSPSSIEELRELWGEGVGSMPARQYLWPEAPKWARRLRLEDLRAGHRGALDQGIEPAHGKAAAAAAAGDASTIEGAHATQVLVIYDEAKGPRCNSTPGSASRGLSRDLHRPTLRRASS